MAPTTATTDTPRATFRRPNASATATKGPRQLPLRRAQPTIPTPRAARMQSHKRIHSTSTPPLEMGTPPDGRAAYCWWAAGTVMRGSTSCRPRADLDEDGDVASDEGRHGRALDRGIRSERTRARRRAGDSGDASGRPGRGATGRRAQVGRVAEGALKADLRERGGRDECDQQAVAAGHRAPSRRSDIRARCAGGQTAGVPPQRVDVWLAVGRRKGLPVDAGVGRHEPHQQRIAGSHGTTVGRTVRYSRRSSRRRPERPERPQPAQP